MLALQLFMMLFNLDELLILHILELILKVAKLAFTFPHLFYSGLHVILDLFFTIL